MSINPIRPLVTGSSQKAESLRSNSISSVRLNSFNKERRGAVLEAPNPQLIAQVAIACELQQNLKRKDVDESKEVHSSPATDDKKGKNSLGSLPPLPALPPLCDQKKLEDSSSPPQNK